MSRRRILEKLELTEISGVDRPCQEGAKVTIMKRDTPEEVRTAALQKRIASLKEQIAKFDPNQARDQQGRWARTGATIARAGRAVGRAAAVTGRFAGNVAAGIILGAAAARIVTRAVGAAGRAGVNTASYAAQRSSDRTYSSPKQQQRDRDRAEMLRNLSSAGVSPAFRNKLRRDAAYLDRARNARPVDAVRTSGPGSRNLVPAGG